MRIQFEYRSIYLPGLSDDDQETISIDSISFLLKERTRTYNRLGGEGWSLIAEHMDRSNYSAIATFRRAHDSDETAVPASEEHDTRPLPPTDPAKQTASYPTLQPDPAAPDAFRLVWEK